MIPTRRVVTRLELEADDVIRLKAWLGRAAGTMNSPTNADQIRRFIKRIDDETLKSTLDTEHP